MLDWNITEDATRLPSGTEEARPPTPPWRRWGWLLVVLLLIIAGAGGGYVSRRVQRGDDAMQQDLLALIRAEEQARRLGVRDRSGDFARREAPQIWRETYRNTFRPPVTAQGVTVTLDSFVVTEDIAQVVVSVDAQTQQRAYRLTPDGWRRIPLAGYEWGPRTTIESATTGTSLTFNESDRAFAETLFADLPRFWNSYVTLRGGNVPPAPLVIEPQELRGPLLHAQSDDDLRVVINSPQVVEVPTHWHLSGEAAVRYAYAELALRPLLTRAQLSRTVPNYGRFLDATKYVLALRWATSPDEYSTLAQRWRTIALSEPWESPLSSVVSMDESIDPFVPMPMEARLLAMADEIYAESGAEGLVAVAQALPRVPNWDMAFRNGSNRSAFDLEMAVEGRTDPAVPALPLTGRLLPSPALAPEQLVTLAPRGAISHVRVEGSPHPILLEGLEQATLSLTLPNGDSMSLPNTCIALFPDATLEGEWQEVGLRLRVTHTTITTLFPAHQFDLAPPPTDTIAYIGLNDHSQSQPVQFTDIAAVRANGSTVPVLSAPNGGVNLYGFYPATQTASAGLLLMPTRIDPICRAMWVAWYMPEKGIMGQWFIRWDTPNSYPNIRWDPVTNRGLLTLVPNNGGNALPYWWLTPDTPPVLGDPDGMIPFVGQPTLLQPGGKALLMVDPVGRDYDLIPLEQEEAVISYNPSPFRYASEIAFDATGEALLLGITDSTGFPPSSLVLRYNGDDPAPDTLWGPTQGIFSSVAADTRQPLFYGLTSQDGTATTLTLLGDGPPRTLARDVEDERLLRVMACREGGVAYLSVAQDGVGVISTLRLHGIFADGTPRFDPVRLPPDATLLLCP